jgi:hypothetical protein
MSGVLRIMLLIAAVFSAWWILLKIRKCKVKMEDAIFWVCFAVILLIMGICPEFTYWLTGVFQMQSPANLIFLIIIFLLIEKVFYLVYYYFAAGGQGHSAIGRGCASFSCR